MLCLNGQSRRIESYTNKFKHETHFHSFNFIELALAGSIIYTPKELPQPQDSSALGL
jgi:hypothetical protein